MDRKEKLKNNKAYLWAKEVTKIMDQYHIDGIVGAIPGGIGDGVTAVFAFFHVYFSMFILRSVPLTLALLCNTLRDIFLGLIPFYVGNVIDFFHKSNKRNMALIEGFINDDEEIVSAVKKRAVFSAVVAVSLLIAIGLMITMLVWLAGKVGSLIFN